ncbi:MAG: hypothetical protein ACPG49_11945 [Chitinophagales bacterium]
MKNYIFCLLALITLSVLQYSTLQAQNTMTSNSEKEIAQDDTLLENDGSNAVTGIVLFVVILQTLMIVLFYKVKSGFNQSNAKMSPISAQPPLKLPISEEDKKDWSGLILAPKPIFNLKHS